MHLSIIVPVYQEARNLERFLLRMAKQTVENYELVCVIDTNSNNQLALIDEHLENGKARVKLIYNSRRQGRYNAIKKASKIATGTYSIIASTSDVFKDDFVARIQAITSEHEVDIVEFSARTHNPVWFHGQQRKTIKITSGNFKKQKQMLFAYTYPFVFNKVFKTDLLKKAANYPRINSQVVNSRFSIEIMFKCFLFAKSYYSLNEKIVRSKKTNNANYNPINILKEWSKLIKSEAFSCYQEELEYNRHFSWQIIYKPYSRHLKGSHSGNKINAFFKKGTSDDFYDSNTYYLKNNKEASLLRKHKAKNSYRAYKEL